jgi:hypothetical protein
MISNLRYLLKSFLLYHFKWNQFGPQKIQISCMGKKVPFWQFFRKADMALFDLCMKKNGPNDFIWSSKEYSIIKFIHKVPLGPSKCSFKCIKVDSQNYLKICLLDFKNFGGLYKFLAYLECIRSYAWSFGYSDPDLSSVVQNVRTFLVEHLLFISCWSS